VESDVVKPGAVARAGVLFAAGSIAGCSLDSSGKTACRTSADCLGGDVCEDNLCRAPRDVRDGGAGGDGGRAEDGGRTGAGGRGDGGGDASGGAVGGAGGTALPAGTGGASGGRDPGAGGESPEGGPGGQGSGGQGSGGTDASAPGCGDGLIAGAEACDDGNLREHDGCSRACQVEAGFGCTRVHGPSSRCFSCAEVLRVDARSSAPTPSGATWADAYAELPAALTEAGLRVAAGCAAELWVAEGRYVPSKTGNRAASFAASAGVALYGGFAGTESSREERRPFERRAVLSGDLSGNDASGPAGVSDNSVHVVRVAGADSTTVLDGFEIRGGNGDTLGNWGAGIVHEGGNGAYRNLVVTGNRASGGGAGCMILAGAPSFESVYFVGNWSGQAGSALQSAGSPTLRGVFALANTGGTAVLLSGGGSPQLDRLVLAGNDGGALNLSSGPLTTTSNLVIAGNRGDNWPGLFLGAGIEVVHATMAFNVSTGALDSAFGVAVGASGVQVRNSVFWGNVPADVDDGDRDAVASSVLAGGGGSENLDADPRFAAAGPGGTWTSAPAFDSARTQTRLVDASASFPPNLAGSFVQVKSAGGTADPRLSLIAENDATGLWVWGDATQWTASGAAYTLRRVTLAADSPAVDTADALHTTATDAALRPRHDVPGRGTATSDRGAYEWSP
jgi:cysteine-rich repeat protein